MARKCMYRIMIYRGVFEDGMETSSDEQDIRFQKRRYLNFKRVFTKSYLHPFKVHVSNFFEFS